MYGITKPWIHLTLKFFLNKTKTKTKTNTNTNTKTNTKTTI